MGSNISNLELFPYPNKIHFASYIRDSSAWTEEAMSLDHYLIDRNLFLFVRISLERILLLIGHTLDHNHFQ
ncbi:hypothetical protein V6Z12_A04G125800 [Gossypium hirsutum]